MSPDPASASTSDQYSICVLRDSNIQKESTLHLGESYLVTRDDSMC